MTRNDTVASALAPESDEDSFVNIMDTEVPAASAPAATRELAQEALKLSLTPRHDVVGLQSTMNTTQICATIHARELPDDESKRAPVDITVGLDISASMSGEKLDLCKTNLELLIRQLLPQDRFCLVTFSDEATIEIPTMKLIEKNKAMALNKIKSLRTKGCTNISAAIGLAAQEMRTIENPNEVRSIFLLTDGHANRGVSDASGIVNIAKGCFADAMDDGSPPISIHCFGYGTNHDDKLLTDIAETTAGGTYYFVENDSNVATAFGDALGGILSVVAQNAALNVGVPPEAANLGVEISKVHHENAFKREDGSFAVTVGDFYAEESRDILLDVTLATPHGNVGATPVPHVFASLSYTDTLKKCPVFGNRVECAVARPPGIEVAQPNPHVMVQWLRVHCTNEIDEADKLSSNGDLDNARTKIRECKNLVKSHQKDNSDPVIDQLAKDLDKVLSGLVSHQVYERYGTKHCKRMKQSHQMQRCIDGMSTENAYRGTFRSAMLKKFDK